MTHDDQVLIVFVFNLYYIVVNDAEILIHSKKISVIIPVKLGNKCKSMI